MKKLFSALMILSLSTACSFSGSADNGERAEYVKNQDEAQQKVSQIKGTYEGILIAQKTNPTTGKIEPIEIPIKIGIYEQLEQVGKDSNGEPKLIPMAKLRYRQEDIVRPDDVLSISFIQENGTIKASRAAQNQPADMTVNARIEGNSLRGEIIKNGKIGDFVVVRTSNEFTTPVSDLDDYMDRLDAQNRKLQGIYVGKAIDKQGPSGLATFPVKLELRAERYFVNGNRVSRLSGTYTRPDLADGAGLRNFPDVSYSLEGVVPALFMSVQGLQNQNFMTISGTLDNGVFYGTLEDRMGRGKLSLKKQTR